MSRSPVLRVLLLAAAVLTLSAPGMGQPVDLKAKFQPQPTCCIGGTWSGSISQNKTKSCPEPAVNEPFTFVIVQDARCGQAVTGQITGTGGGGVLNFTGTVKQGANRCCLLEGTLTKPSDPTEKVTISIDICTKEPFAGSKAPAMLVGNGTAHTVYGNPSKPFVCDGTIQMKRQ